MASTGSWFPSYQDARTKRGISIVMWCRTGSCTPIDGAPYLCPRRARVPRLHRDWWMGRGPERQPSGRALPMRPIGILSWPAVTVRCCEFVAHAALAHTQMVSTRQSLPELPDPSLILRKRRGIWLRGARLRRGRWLDRGSGDPGGRETQARGASVRPMRIWGG